MDIANEDRERAEKQSRVDSGRTLIAAGIGAAFAAALTVVGGQLKGELAGKSLYLLGPAITLFGIRYFATLPGHERRHHVSVLMGWMPVLGVVCLVVGLAMLLEDARGGAGYLFGLVAILGVWVCVQAEDRAKKLAGPAVKSAEPSMPKIAA